MKQLKNQLTKTIPSSLINFDDMPDSAYVSLSVVLGIYSLSRASVYRGIKNETFPKPVKLSEKRVAWNVGAIRADLAEKAGVQ